MRRYKIILIGVIAILGLSIWQGRRVYLSWRLAQAQALLDEGMRLEAAARFDDAEQILKRAQAQIDALVGPHHLLSAVAWKRLAGVYQDKGKFAEAEAGCQRAIDISRQNGDKGRKELAAVLSNLGLLRYNMGRPVEAIALYEEAMQIWIAVVGPRSYEAAGQLTLLASAQASVGNMVKAEDLCHKALELYSGLKIKEDGRLAVVIHTLGSIYGEQGYYDRAYPLLERSLDLFTRIHGPAHPMVAYAYNNIGTIAMKQGRYAVAAENIEKGYAIRRKALGEKHPETALALANLADTYVAKGDLKRGLAGYEESAALLEGVMGPFHPYVLLGKTSIASTLLQLGETARATALLESFEKSADNLLRSGGHYLFMASLFEAHARALALQGRRAEAIERWKQSFAVAEQRIEREALTMDEERRRSFFETLRAQDEAVYTELSRHLEDAALRRFAASSVLLRKGRALDVSAAVSQAIYGRLSAADRKEWDRLRMLGAEFARQAIPGGSPLSGDALRQSLDTLHEQVEQGYRQLVKRLEEAHLLRTQLPDVDNILDKVRAALPASSVLIEIIKVQERPLSRAFIDPKAEWRYLALLIKDRDNDIAVVDLGSAARMDAAVRRALDGLSDKTQDPIAATAQLYQSFWKPLEPALLGRARLFVSADGELNRVPIHALYDGSRYLRERFEVNYLTSGRDLLPRGDRPPPSAEVVVFANPIWAEAPLAQAMPTGTRTTRTLTLANLEPLPGTEKEALAIKDLLPQTRLYLQREASEAQLMKIELPGILHLATHGVLWDGSQHESAAERTIGVTSDEAPRDPLVRHMLVMAGARLLREQRLLDNPEDGLVTAMELSGMNLSRTQLVVLSACNTGLGELPVGQGVYGMRRAAMVAGAETLVTSLWRVDDKGTTEYMTRYYRHLIDGQGRLEALSAAAQEIQAMPAYQHPYYWASFILIGQSSPLRGIKPR